MNVFLAGLLMMLVLNVFPDLSGLEIFGMIVLIAFSSSELKSWP